MIRTVILMASLLCLANEPVFPEQPAATEDEVFALEPAALAGERESVRVLFELYSSADGAVYEYIDVVLGRMISNHPQLFLEELLRTGPKTHLEGLVGNTGEELVDLFREQLVELKVRRAALSTVKNSSLLEVRDTCIRILDKKIVELEEIAAQQGAPAGPVLRTGP